MVFRAARCLLHLLTYHSSMIIRRTTRAYPPPPGTDAATGAAGRACLPAHHLWPLNKQAGANTHGREQGGFQEDENSRCANGPKLVQSCEEGGTLAAHENAPQKRGRDVVATVALRATKRTPPSPALGRVSINICGKTFRAGSFHIGQYFCR